MKMKGILMFSFGKTLWILAWSSYFSSISKWKMTFKMIFHFVMLVISCFDRPRIQLMQYYCKYCNTQEVLLKRHSTYLSNSIWIVQALGLTGGKTGFATESHHTSPLTHHQHPLPQMELRPLADQATGQGRPVTWPWEEGRTGSRRHIHTKRRMGKWDYMLPYALIHDS